MIKENWKEMLLAVLGICMVFFVGFLVLENLQKPMIYAQGYCVDKEGIQHIDFPKDMVDNYAIKEVNCSNKENPLTWNSTTIT
jgi:hypothetical protein